MRSIVQDTMTLRRAQGIPLGQCFRTLKSGITSALTAIQTRLHRELDNAHRFAELLAQTSDSQVPTPIPLQTVCIRH